METSFPQAIDAMRQCMAHTGLCPVWNGAGGNRTPVPKQSAGRLYARSRRVFSARESPTTAVLRDMTAECLAPPAAVSPSEPARCLRSPPHRASDGDRAAQLGSKSVLRFSSCVFASFLRGQDAPRRATAGLPCPVDAWSAPDVKERCESSSPMILRLPAATVRAHQCAGRAATPDAPIAREVREPATRSARQVNAHDADQRTTVRGRS